MQQGAPDDPDGDAEDDTDDQAGDDARRLDLQVGRLPEARAAYDALPVAAGRVVGPEHVYAAANAALRGLVGRTDVVGRSVREVYEGLDGQHVFEVLDRCFRTGEAVSLREFRVQLDVAGDGHPVDVFVDWHLVPYRDEVGTVVGIDYTAADVTGRVRERRRAEARARDAERRHATALEVIGAVQDVLLPRDVPVVPGLDVAARYLLAAENSAAGGDWFDAVLRPDGRVALVVGDVVGHGVEASAVMAQLRAVLQERLLGEGSLEDALTALDRYAQHAEGARSATVCVAEVAPATGSVRYATAGHPPPLRLGEDGTASYLVPTGGGPLATGSRPVTAQATLAEGDLLLLFTDGLVERPGRSWAESTVEVAQVVSDVALDRGPTAGASRRRAERVCEVGLELLTRTSGHADDVTLLAAQRTPVLAPLTVTLPAGPASLALVRDDLGDWLGLLGARTSDRIAAVHAVLELVTNVVEHAYGDQPAATDEVVVEVALHPDGMLRGTVTDHGAWVDRAPVSVDDPGRGLALAGGLVDELEVHRSSSGTRVDLALRLTRAVRTLTDVPPSATQGPAPATAQGARRQQVEIRVEGGRLAVSGPLDLVGTTRLEPHLRLAAQHRDVPVELWLDGVTHLGSTAVRLLHEHVRRGAVVLRASTGTTAQQVLTLVGLPAGPPDEGATPSAGA